MAKIYGITQEKDKVAIASILVKYGYTVRITADKQPNSKRTVKVLEYFKEEEKST